MPRPRLSADGWVGGSVRQRDAVRSRRVLAGPSLMSAPLAHQDAHCIAHRARTTSSLQPTRSTIKA
eukprot:2602504-Rhodomonas_salina.2